MKMSARTIPQVLCFMVLTAATSCTPAATPADWTVMVYLNGDNNLESFAIDDFLEMSTNGSTSNLNIIVQLDRNGAYDARFGAWTNTLRFKVEKGVEPWPTNALPGFSKECDMGDPKTLTDFVAWAQDQYPAKRNMLIIWDHGAGWKFYIARLQGLVRAEPIAIAPSRPQYALTAPVTSNAGTTTAGDHPVKSVSHDETSGNILYNRAIQDGLARILKQPLDIIAFDACLMQTLETAFAFRKIAHILAASEELEPGAGWNHVDWSLALGQHPDMDGEVLAKTLVNSYAAQYSNATTPLDQHTTFSAMNLNRIDELAQSVDALGKRLAVGISNPKTMAEMMTARSQCAEYGGSGYGLIDLGRFCDRIGAKTSDSNARKLAANCSQQMRSMVITNYAHKVMLTKHGGQGISIYLPNDANVDQAYTKTNKVWPVEFVQRYEWCDFVAKFNSAISNE